MELNIKEFKPVGSFLLIKIIKPETPASGLIIPEHVQVKAESKAIVVQVGTTCSLGVKIGHEVMFKNGAQGMQIDEEHHLIPEVSIAAILNYTKEEKG